MAAQSKPIFPLVIRRAYVLFPLSYAIVIIECTCFEDKNENQIVFCTENVVYALKCIKSK